MRENKLKTDLLAASFIGILASIFSLIVIKNLSLNIPFGKPFFVFIPLCVAGIFVARFLGKRIPVFYQFGKFGETGGLNWLVDFGFLNLFILISGISTGLYFSFFKAVSFIVSVINSYFWNKFWVFKKTGKEKSSQEFGKFSLVSLVGLGINVILASFIVFLGPKIIFDINSKIWANIAAAFGSLTAMMWNFLGYKFFVFKK